jgi:hypothetical protein
MSELTSCCYCSLQFIRTRAREEGKRVFLRPGMMGGTDVFAVAKGEKLDISVDKKGNHGKQWRAWMMELTDSCVC